MATCSYCGEYADEAAMERIGQTRAYTCDSSECNLELQRDARDAYEREYEDAIEEVNARFERW